MRLHILTCLMVMMQAIGFAFGSPTHFSPDSNTPVALTLTIDSIHQINCLRATGYLSVKAAGGVAPYLYNWSNGNTGSLATDLAAGAYQITVTDDNGETASLSVTITENFSTPEANAGTDFNLLCANTVSTLNGAGSSTGPGVQYIWTASNGGVFQSGVNTLTPTIRHSGTFTLKVTDIASGCTATASVTVTATHEPPSLTATGGVFTCVTPVTLNATFPSQNTTFIWNGPNNFSSNQLHPQVSIVGTFIIKVADTLTTCLNTANAIVTADTAKPTVLPLGGTLTCSQPTLVILGTYAPPTATYLWSGPNNFSSTQQYPTVTLAGQYRVTVTNPANGCTKSNTATVLANFVPPTITASVSGPLSCTNLAVQLFGNGSPAGLTYSWIGPLGFTSTLQNPSVTNPGNYTVTVQNPQNGCTAAAMVTVQSNTTPPGVSATGGLKTCTNPTVQLTATSGTTGVIFRWVGPNNFVSTQQNPIVSIAGTYTVTATNSITGCTSSATAVVTQNTTVPNLTTTTATVSCYIPDPHIVASSTTQGVTYGWTGPNDFTSSISNPIVTFGGYYTVTVTNPVNGCTATKTIFVDENLATPNVYAGDDRTLNCNFTSILANPIGTSTGNNITYLWTTYDGNIVSGATTLYARFDAPGTYTLTVKNTTSGCMVKDSMNVEYVPEVIVSNSIVNGISCNGGSNGSIKATPTGGSSPYTYIWSNGGATATISNLSAGTFTVTVTDFSGCTTSASTTLLQPSPLVVTVNSTNQTQAGVNNGTATVNPSGGTAPYNILWSNGSTFITVVNLAPGSYTVTVTDSKGCSQTGMANINPVNCNITGSVTTTNLICAGTPTGTATVSVTGAASPVNYIWSNSNNTQTASNLAAGSYTVTVTGSNGCSIVLSGQVTAPPALQLSVVSNTPVSCSGLLNGAATMSASGGVSPYTYQWSTGSTAATISGVAVGTYTCTTTDANHCTAVQTVQITGPQPVVLAIATKTDVACVDGQTGSITMDATGGTSPYTFVWSNNAGGPTASNLGVGNYICTVTDSRGCSKNLNAQIVATDNVPPQLVLKNASVALNANGTASVTPALFDNGSFDQSCDIVNWTVNLTSVSCAQLGTNTVTLSATDKNGNTATGSAILTVLDNIPPTLTCPANQTAPACASTITFTAPQVQDNCSASGPATQTGGLPSGATFPVGVTQQQFSYTDGGGNTATCQFTVTVTGGVDGQVSTLPTSCSGNCDGSAVVTLFGGGSVNAVWSNGQNGLTATGLCPGTYFVTLTDGSGCSQSFAAEVHVQDLQAPQLICPADIAVGFCNTQVNYNLPQVLDNCNVNQQNLQLISGLPTGSNFPIGVSTQTFRYTDGGGNSGECSFNVTVHLPASVNSSSTQINCAGSCTGSATISVSGGQGPFSVLWSSGAAGPVAVNLCAGMYQATVSDADGCPQIQTIQIVEPAPLQLSFSNVVNDHANAGVGSITLAVQGGTLPYTYAWTKNGVPFSTSQHLFGLFAGEYILTVTDAKGCVFISNTFVVNSTVATDEPSDAFHWKLYPNPAQSELFLQMDDPGGRNARLSVYDPSGRLLIDRELEDVSEQTVRIDLAELPDGLLLVRLITDKGNFSKVVVKGGSR